MTNPNIKIHQMEDRIRDLREKAISYADQWQDVKTSIERASRYLN